MLNRTSCRWLAPIGVGLAVTLPIEARGQEPGAETNGGFSAEVYFPEDTDNRDIRVVTLSAEREWYAAAGLWLSGHVGVVFTEGVFAPDDVTPRVELEADGFGVGTAGLLRWRPIAVGPFEPFAELGVGLLLMTEPFPPGGTRGNLNRRSGLGVRISVSEELAVAVGYRHLHVSNGQGLVPENPSYDGNGFMLALSW